MTPGFPATVADNVNALLHWHNEHHPFPWTTCVYEPCKIMDPEFRKLWD